MVKTIRKYFEGKFILNGTGTTLNMNDPIIISNLFDLILIKYIFISLYISLPMGFEH